ncbi:MAG: hypothetical protein J6X30_03010 [Clostridia bacterium]|nr:hypothetical protein [Clostridia bacterium]
MEAFLWIAAVLLCLYVVFVFAPAVVFFETVFRRAKKSGEVLLDTENPYYTPYAERFAQATAVLRGLPRRTISFEASDHTPLRALFYDAGSDKTAVFLHGYNAPPLNNFAPQAALLYREGFNLAFVFQRAHGGSGGRTTMGCLEQRDLLDFLPVLTHNTATKEVLLYGMSMGCTATAYASDRLDPDLVKAMILDCGYTSPYAALTREMRRHHVPVFLLAPWVTFFARVILGISIKKTVTDSLKRTRVPALFLHGGADQTVPAAQGRENFEACASPKEWYTHPEALHTTCYLSGGEEAQRRLLTFVRTYFS